MLAAAGAELAVVDDGTNGGDVADGGRDCAELPEGVAVVDDACGCACGEAEAEFMPV